MPARRDEVVPDYDGYSGNPDLERTLVLDPDGPPHPKCSKFCDKPGTRTVIDAEGKLHIVCEFHAHR